MTSVPVASGVACRERLRPARVGVNEQRIVEPAAGVSVKRLPERRARIETIIGAVPMPTVVPIAAVVPVAAVVAPVGVVVGAPVVVAPVVAVAPVVVVAPGAMAPVPAIVPVLISPACSATAVYPPVVDATIRPVRPSDVVNWLPVIVSVVSPVSPRASQLNLPV